MLVVVVPPPPPHTSGVKEQEVCSICCREIQGSTLVLLTEKERTSSTSELPLYAHLACCVCASCDTSIGEDTRSTVITAIGGGLVKLLCSPACKAGSKVGSGPCRICGKHTDDGVERNGHPVHRSCVSTCGSCGRAFTPREVELPGLGRTATLAVRADLPDGRVGRHLCVNCAPSLLSCHVCSATLNDGSRTEYALVGAAQRPHCVGCVPAANFTYGAT
uniref:Uncharacterized protein n=1 Tax=Sexangularia sp. CB-2014 TaxID=1486929 RepID=A0A7S1VCJ6_9EUKA